MKIQTLNTGQIVVDYGAPVEYQSPLMIDECWPSFVTYKCGVTLEHVGKVYSTTDGRWWLTTTLLPDCTPVEVFSKIGGFFLINQIHKQIHEH